MQDRITFDPTSFRKGAAGMDDAGQDLSKRTSALLAEVTDLSVLGTYDTLGGVAQMIYSAFLEVFQETASDLSAGYEDTGAKLSAAGDLYADTERAATEAANQAGGL